MRYQTEYVLYTACYTVAFNTDEVDLDDLDEVSKKHLGCYAILMGLNHGKTLAVPLTPKEFDIRMMDQDDDVASQPAPAHAPGDAAERPE